jgi:choline-glycine betaine transporter
MEKSQAHRPEIFSSVAIDWKTFTLSGGFLLLFVVVALFDIELLSAKVNEAFSFTARLFGPYWQVLLPATFFLGLLIAVSPAGRVRMGNIKVAELATYKWFSIIMCTLLAGGGVFFAAAEPLSHFISPAPLFEVEGSSEAAVQPALAQSFLHWGFLAWAILGSLTTIVFMHLHYDLGLPLKPRTLLFPVFGERALHGWLGSIVDAACVLAVVAGTVGPIGFLGLQVSYGLSVLFGIENSYLTQSLIIIGLIGIYTISTVSGIQRGIQMLSTFNVFLALFLMAYMMIVGPSSFIFQSYIHSAALHLEKFIPMAAFRADKIWLDSWTVFFWGWFLGYGPLMAMFIARISNGRSIRQIVLAVSIAAPIITTFWYTIVGGTGIFFELTDPGSISVPFTGFNMPAALLAITQNLPLGFLVSILFLVLTTIFVATTGDSMTYTISMVMTGTDDPPSLLRIFWGVMMGVVAMILVSIGSGGISALQYFIVVTAAPVSLILLPSLWVAPAIALKLAKGQSVTAE